jgi:hypothetical protein
MKKIIKILIFFTVCNLYQMLTGVSHVSAQSVDLGIYPPVIQAQATAPSDVSTPFYVQNFSDSSVDLNISIAPFTASPLENGTVSFLDDLNSFPDPSLLEKIHVLDGDNSIQTITLAPKQKRNLNLLIQVPDNQTKGDYYISLIFTSGGQNPVQANSAQASAGIVSNILLSIGPVGETKGYIEDFSAPAFVAKGPLPFTVRVKNTSDHYITPKGDIVITNMFGQNVGKINLLPVNLLSNTVRRIPDSIQSDVNSKDYAGVKAVADKNQYPMAVWPEKFLVGPYTATLTLALSGTGPLFKRSIVFFAFPAEYSLGILAIIIVIIFVVLRVKKKLP